MIAVPGLVDAHTHLLRAASGIPFPWAGSTVASFHRKVASDGATPMDVPEPPAQAAPAELAQRLQDALRAAAAAGLVEVTEMGMRAWWYWDALQALAQPAAPPVRVRLYLASGLASSSSLRDLDARRSDCGPWIRLEGIKFYADGWLVPRTCALCQPFHDDEDSGLLFLDAAALARRIAPFAERGWRIATHAIGDRGIETVLDAYEAVWGNDPAAIAAAAPRVEHASIQSAGLAARMAALGVVACIQPSFAVTDAPQLAPALGAGRTQDAYPWQSLARAGARLIAGSDYPIEVQEPLVGLARLVSGRSQRAGFQTPACAPAGSRLDSVTAFALMSDSEAGETFLSADPRAIPAAAIDQVEVSGTNTRPFTHPAPAGSSRTWSG